MFCRKCGTKLDDDMLFCPKCGARSLEAGQQASQEDAAAHAQGSYGQPQQDPYSRAQQDAYSQQRDWNSQQRQDAYSQLRQQDPYSRAQQNQYSRPQQGGSYIRQQDSYGQPQRRMDSRQRDQYSRPQRQTRGAYQQPEPEKSGGSVGIAALLIGLVLVAGALGFFGTKILLDRGEKVATQEATTQDASVQTTGEQESVAKLETGAAAAAEESAEDIAAKEAAEKAEKEKAEKEKAEREKAEKEKEEKEKEENDPKSGHEGDIFVDSGKRYLSESEIQRLSDEQLRIAINEIYARNGYKFSQSQEMVDYFGAKSWYKGTITDQEAVKKEFNDYERANVDLMGKIRESRK